MNFKQLQYFLVTAQNGSIASAARALDIAQPAISQQLANLEHELRTTLFDRDFRGVSLTDSGRIFLEYAKSVVLQIDQVKQQLSELESHPAGVVSVGMTQSISHVLATAIIAEVEAAYPDIEIQLNTGVSSRVHYWLDHQEVDIAIAYYQPLEGRAVKAVPMLKEQLYAVFSNRLDSDYQALLSRNKISFAELAKYQVTVPNQRSALATILHSYEAKTGITLQHKTPAGQLMNALQRVTEKDEMLIMPSSVFYHLEASQQVHSLLITEPEIEGEILLMTAADKPQSKAVHTVCNIIGKVVQQAYYEQKWRGRLLYR